MLALLVMVERKPFSVAHSSDRARKGSSQGFGNIDRTAHGELELLVDVTRQAPRVILGPHEVGLLPAVHGAVPSQLWGISEHLDGSGEQQHRPMRDVDSWSFWSGGPARPVFPDRRVCARGGVGVLGESREHRAKSVLLPPWVFVGRLVGERDTYVHSEPWRTVAKQGPP